MPKRRLHLSLTRYRKSFEMVPSGSFIFVVNMFVCVGVVVFVRAFLFVFHKNSFCVCLAFFPHSLFVGPNRDAFVADRMVNV